MWSRLVSAECIEYVKYAVYIVLEKRKEIEKKEIGIMLSHLSPPKPE